jgi:hypothetical protein
VDVKSEVVARRIVTAGRKYVDWLPFDRHTEPRASAFLSGGRPFSKLENSDRRALDQLDVIRNALAHESSHSLRQFRRLYTEGKALPVDQLTPSGYLRGQHSIGTTRFTNTLNEVAGIFGRLCG